MFTDLAQNCNGQRSKPAQNYLYAPSKPRRDTRFDEVKERDS
jgi:hypothetical protein